MIPTRFGPDRTPDTDSPFHFYSIKTEAGPQKSRRSFAFDDPLPLRTYSFDESFLNLGEFHEREVAASCVELRVSASNAGLVSRPASASLPKTLANEANFIAKKRPQYRGVWRICVPAKCGRAAPQRSWSMRFGDRRVVDVEAFPARFAQIWPPISLHSISIMRGR